MASPIPVFRENALDLHSLAIRPGRCRVVQRRLARHLRVKQVVKAALEESEEPNVADGNGMVLLTAVRCDDVVGSCQWRNGTGAHEELGLKYSDYAC